jgi:hypothetical protein
VLAWSLATSLTTSLTACGEDEPELEPWIELGQGALEFQALAAGDSLELVCGQQGLLMFPIAICGGGFRLPADATDITDPDAPLLDLYIDIDGFNIGFGGHFSFVSGRPLTFTVRDDGTYEHLFVAALVPDELADASALEGVNAVLRASLEVVDVAEPLVDERVATVRLSSEPGSACR